MIEIKLDDIRIKRIIDYPRTENNAGKYTIRYVIHEDNIGHRIHISKNRIPQVMINLYSENLDEILKIYNIKLIRGAE